MNTMLIETGTYVGDGVKAALSNGFKFVVSIELNDGMYHKAAKEFARYPQVRIFHGSSEDLLWEIIRDIGLPITFWLDAHFSGAGTSRGKKNSPVLEELAIIGRHPLKNHTILIDDRRQMGKDEFDGTTEAEICAAIKSINPQYSITYEQGDPQFPADILVARV